MAYDGEDKILEEVTGKAYEFGFTTDIDSDKARRDSTKTSFG